jgi:hypothetical protein
MPMVDNVPWEVISVDPYKYRCAWDDRFALANIMLRHWRSCGMQVVVGFVGESLLSDDSGIATYKTVVLTVRVARSQLIDDLKFDMTEATRKELKAVPDGFTKASYADFTNNSISGLIAPMTLTNCTFYSESKPIESLPLGWIDRGATVLIQSQNPGSWFQSQKWDLLECMMFDKTVWKLICRQNNQPVDGVFDTKEEAFCYADDFVPDGCTKVKIVNIMPTIEQFESSLQGHSPFMKIEPETKPSDPESKQETWRDRKSLLW